MTLFLLSACAGNGARNAVSENSNIAPQSNSDRGKAVLQLGGGTVSVDYGRPALKGRDLEKLIERGQEWRMGSNAPTTLETDIDLKFGDQTIPKGKYFLKAKPVEQQEWVMLIQTPDNTTVAEAPLSFQKVDPSLELLTIELAEKNNGGTLMLHWGNLALSTDFQKA
jgi:hypothetical protein